MDRTVAGLCGACLHARRVVSVRGSVFWRCDRSATDARFMKYPALPVHVCRGFETMAKGTPARDEASG